MAFLIHRIAFVSDHEPVTPNYVRQDILRLLYGIMLEARHEAVRVNYFIHSHPRRLFSEALHRKKFDGVIFALMGFGAETRKQLKGLARRMPCVACMVRPPVQGIPYIGTDTRSGYRDQINRLMGHGLSTFGYIGSFYGKHSIDRFLTVRDRLRDKGVRLEQQWVPGFSVETGKPRLLDPRMRAFIKDLPGNNPRIVRILAANADRVIGAFLENDSFPDAVLCEYDYFAEHLYLAAAGRGIAIPGKFALTGFGNERYPFPPHGETFLSTMHEDFTEIGRFFAQAVIHSTPRMNDRPDILLDPVQIPGLSEYKGKVDPAVADTVRFSQAVQSVLAEEPDIEDPAGVLAIKTHLSKRYFLQRFKQIYQETFRDFMNDRRLEQASFMLRNSSEPIIRIALRCGFNNIQPFNRLFRLKYRTTPTQYRG